MAPYEVSGQVRQRFETSSTSFQLERVHRRGEESLNQMGDVAYGNSDKHDGGLSKFLPRKFLVIVRHDMISNDLPESRTFSIKYNN